MADRHTDRLDACDLALTHSAVLLLTWPSGDDTWLAVTRRTPNLRAHPDEMALPGGQIEPGESPAQAALREAAEETGIDPTTVEVLGYLDQAWTGAAFLVSPVVAWTAHPPQFVASADEISAVIALSLHALADPRIHRTAHVAIGHVDYVDDVLDHPDASIRGVTADIIVDLLEWIAGRDRRRAPDRTLGLHAFAALRNW